MKLVLRTLAILAAALVVAAGVYAFGQSSFGQQLRSAGPGRGGFDREGGPPPGFEQRAGREAPPAGFAGGERPEGFAGHGGRAGHGPSLAGLAEVGKNLAIVAVCVAVIALGARLLKLVRPGGRGRTPPDRATTG